MRWIYEKAKKFGAKPYNEAKDIGDQNHETRIIPSGFCGRAIRKELWLIWRLHTNCE